MGVSQEKEERDSRLILLYKGQKGPASISADGLSMFWAEI